MERVKLRGSKAHLSEKDEREEQDSIPAEEERQEEPGVEIPAEMLFLEAELIATLLRESGTRR